MTNVAAAKQFDRRADPLAVFALRCDVRAYLVSIGKLALHDGVDGLQYDAEFDGLIDQFGQDAIQAILAAEFGRLHA